MERSKRKIALMFGCRVFVEIDEFIWVFKGNSKLDVHMRKICLVKIQNRVVY